MVYNTPIIIISGPTASGKTKLSLRLARKYNGIIINADSVQVFSDIPILTAQPTSQERDIAPHKLFGYLSAKEGIDANSWLNTSLANIEETIALEKIPFLVGGTGLYLKSLIEGIASVDITDKQAKASGQNLLLELGKKAFYERLITLDPLIKDRIHQNDSQRMIRAYEVITSTGTSIIEWQKKERTRFFSHKSFLYIFITPPREVLYQNCNTRFEKMVDHGVINEVENLYNIIGDEQYNITKAHGYKEIVKYLKNEWDLKSVIENSQIITRQYAKRQITWFKHQVKNGHFLEYDDFDLLTEEVDKLIYNFLKNF